MMCKKCGHEHLSAVHTDGTWSRDLENLTACGNVVEGWRTA